MARLSCVVVALRGRLGVRQASAHGTSFMAVLVNTGWFQGKAVDLPCCWSLQDGVAQCVPIDPSPPSPAIDKPPAFCNMLCVIGKHCVIKVRRGQPGVLQVQSGCYGLVPIQCVGGVEWTAG